MTNATNKAWKRLRLGELVIGPPAYGANASSIPYVEGVTPRYVRITDITEDGLLKSEGIVGIDPELAAGNMLEDGDIVVAPTGASVGKSLLFRAGGKPTAFAGYLIRFRPDPLKCDRDYVRQCLHSDRYWTWVKQTLRAGAQPNINSTEYASFPVPLPGLREQRRLAAILGAWDRAIEKLQTLVQAKTERLGALRQQLLTGTRRFPKFKNERWGHVPLGDVVTHEPRLTTKPKGVFLAAGVRSHGKGVFLKPDFDAEDIALDELFELRTDDLVVNITFGWEGAVAIVPPEANGALVSHRFPTFVFRSGVSFPGYFRHVVRLRKFVFEVGLASPGGAGRNRVLSKQGFLRILIDLPSLEEQQPIAGFLNACEREIRLLGAELEEFKQQKRGLMQKLLTGEIRVKP